MTMSPWRAPSRTLPAILLVLGLLMIQPQRAIAQATSADPTGNPPNNPLCQKFAGALTPAELVEYQKACVKPKTEQVSSNRPTAPTCGTFGVDDKALALDLQKACGEDIKNGFSYAAKLRQYNIDLYQWQRKASDDMRILVWFVVLAGVGMAIYQLIVIMQIELWRARRRPGKTAADPANAGGGAGAAIPAQQLELGLGTLGKVQVTSSIVGVVVLVISIAFLYLYLTEVYTIKPPV